jgi:hypothetical protein
MGLTILYCLSTHGPTAGLKRNCGNLFMRTRNSCDPCASLYNPLSLPACLPPRPSRPVLSLEEDSSRFASLPSSPQWRRNRLHHRAACQALEREDRDPEHPPTNRAPSRCMAAPGLDQVMAFLTDHGFAGAASALRDDVLARTAAGDGSHAAALDPHLPPLRMPASAAGAGAGTPAPASPGSSSGSASSSAFVSMRSTPSGTQGTRHFCR